VLTYNEEAKNDRFALFENPIIEKIDPFDHLHPPPLPLQVPKGKDSKVYAPEAHIMYLTVVS
jgi:hypothetical protein